MDNRKKLAHLTVRDRHGIAVLDEDVVSVTTKAPGQFVAQLFDGRRILCHYEPVENGARWELNAPITLEED